MSDHPSKHYRIALTLFAFLAAVGLAAFFLGERGFVLASLAAILLLAVGALWELRRHELAEIRRKFDLP